MRTDGPIDRIVSILEDSKAFRQVNSPIRIGNVPFEFAAVLLGTGKNPDLVLVIDTLNENVQRTRQKIGGLGRAMDVVGSRRPVTAILAGPRPDEATLESIARVCRVLPVGTPAGTTGDRLLQDWLSVLLPLNLPSQTSLAADPVGEVRRLMPDGIDQELSNAILHAAPRGAPAVQAELKRRLSTPLAQADERLEAKRSETSE
jgi:hypothetical protein